MNHQYRLFRRGWGTFYSEDLTTGKQESLKTRDKHEATRLIASKNEAQASAAFSRKLAKVYWQSGDPQTGNRTWQWVMDELLKLKKGPNENRWKVAIQDEAYDSIRSLPIVETRPEHFLAVLASGGVSTNTFFDEQWLAKAVDVVARYWKTKNERRKPSPNSTT